MIKIVRKLQFLLVLVNIRIIFIEASNLFQDTNTILDNYFEKTGEPTIAPSLLHQTSSSLPTKTQSILISMIPSSIPSIKPSKIASNVPSTSPSSFPTLVPSVLPTMMPSIQTSTISSSTPSYKPSYIPSEVSSTSPSLNPTQRPSRVPSVIPSTIPSSIPSNKPSYIPSEVSSTLPSLNPTQRPSRVPSVIPSTIPSIQTSMTPSSTPNNKPSYQPTYRKSRSPSESTSSTSSDVPTDNGNMASITSEYPSTKPSFEPTISPSILPSSISTFTQMPHLSSYTFNITLHVSHISRELNINEIVELESSIFEMLSDGVCHKVDIFSLKGLDTVAVNGVKLVSQMLTNYYSDSPIVLVILLNASLSYNHQENDAQDMHDLMTKKLDCLNTFSEKIIPKATIDPQQLTVPDRTDPKDETTSSNLRIILVGIGSSLLILALVLSMYVHFRGILVYKKRDIPTFPSVAIPYENQEYDETDFNSESNHQDYDNEDVTFASHHHLNNTEDESLPSINGQAHVPYTEFIDDDFDCVNIHDDDTEKMRNNQDDKKRYLASSSSSSSSISTSMSLQNNFSLDTNSTTSSNISYSSSSDESSDDNNC